MMYTTTPQPSNPNVYEIPYSSIMGGYNEQVPLFITQRGIKASEFKATMNRCTEITKESVMIMNFLTFAFSIALFVLEFIVMALCFGVIFGFVFFIGPEPLYLIILMLIFGGLFLFVGVGFAVMIPALRKYLVHNLKNEMTEYLEKCNQVLSKKGIQLMFVIKSTWVFTSKKRDVVPSYFIQVLIAPDPNAKPSTVYVLQSNPQPVGYYQQQPQQMNPFVGPQMVIQQQQMPIQQQQQIQIQPQQAPSVPVYTPQNIESPSAPLMPTKPVQDDYNYFGQ